MFLVDEFDMVLFDSIVQA